MSLRLKGGLVVAAVFLSFALLEQFVQTRLTMRAFQEIETTSALRDLQSCSNTIKGELDSLANYVYTWSAWDDSVQYVRDHNQAFADSNLTTAAFDGVDIQLMAYYNVEGRLVYGEAFDSEYVKRKNPDFIVEQAPAGNPLYFHKKIDDNLSGLIESSEGIWLLCSQPIINSQQTGPISGTLIMGRLLDGKRLESLRAKTQVNLDLRPFRDETIRDIPKEVISGIKPDAPFLRPASNEVLGGFIEIPGLDGQRFLLTASIPRDITIRGKLSLRWEMLTLMAMAFVTVSLLMLFYEASVFRRILRFKDFFGKVKSSGDLSQRLNVGGQDELSDLADDVNLMLVELQASRGQLDLALQDAKAADEAKSQFLATMSHEIRTPMNGVLGMLSVLLDTPLGAEQKDFAQTAKQSAEGLLRILNDILDFSKLEAGRLEVEKIEFSVRSMIEESVRIMSVRAAEKGLELLCRVEKDVPDRLKGDPGRLRQIIVNLLSNSIKFTKHGEVVLHVERIEQTEQQVELRFKVEDTGIGIPPESQHRLFKSFSQADASTTRKFGGTGLGLVICKQLANLMDGDMGFSSISGRGSTFWFTVKLDAPEGHEGGKLVTRGQLAGRRALIVDDNQTNRKILDAQFSDWGMLTSQAANGDEALRLLREAAGSGQSFEIAIIDYQMPGIDGRQLAMEIQSDPSISGLKTVLLTSAGARGDAALMAEAGFNAYLTKPVGEEMLRSCIMAVLNQGDQAAEGGHGPLITKHLLREFGTTDLKILLAEDNKVNQKVGLTLLSRLGLSADTVMNGREAVDAVEAGDYDLVLMDCHMPEMDGFEATAHIRALQGPRKKTPIIAMTARAMTGDRETCLAAGMTDYVTKPVRLEDLRLAIERCCNVQLGIVEAQAPGGGRRKEDESAQAVELASTGTAMSAGAAPEVDPVAVMEVEAEIMNIEASIRRQGDREFWVELVNVFFDECDKRIRSLREAVEARSSLDVQHEAHGLKGSASEILAERFRLACLKLELAGRSEETESFAGLMASLDAEFEALREHLEPELIRETVASLS